MGDVISHVGDFLLGELAAKGRHGALPVGHAVDDEGLGQVGAVEMRPDVAMRIGIGERMTARAAPAGEDFAAMVDARRVRLSPVAAAAGAGAEGCARSWLAGMPAIASAAKSPILVPPVQVFAFTTPSPFVMPQAGSACVTPSWPVLP